MDVFGAGCTPLDRALAYPYPRLPGSFVLVGETAYLYAEVGPDPLRTGSILVNGRSVPTADFLPASDEPRFAVLGYGSNASPVQLRNKYRDAGPVVMPTLRAEIVGLDVVYAPIVSYYGSIPATLAVSPGVRAEAWVQLLTEAQLTEMHASEARGVHYDFGRLTGPAVAVDGAFEPDEVFVYWTCEGALADEDGPIPMAPIPTVGRTRPGRTQIEMQEWARSLMGSDEDLAGFVTEGIREKRSRGRRMAKLREHAVPRDDSRFEMIPG